MRIAFDGTVLHGRKSGVGYYCEELLKAMLALDQDNQFVVFSHQPLTLKYATANGNLKFTQSGHFPVRAFYLHAVLPNLLESVEPDLCHYTNFLAPITQRRPFVVTIHDMGMELMPNSHPIAKRLYTKRLVPRIAQKASLIITNSEYSKWEIVRCLGISEDRLRVTPLAASPEFAPVAGRQAERPYFLYVGNLEPRKNLERLIEAFARMPHKDHDLVIVGNRWYRGGAAESKARALGLNGRVKFKGYVDRADLPALFSGATAFIYPSLLEGFGLPVVEAMACGTPVITSNTSSMKEIAADAAMLVDPRDVRHITEALTRMAEDEPLRESLSRKGLARAAQFSWEKTARLTLNVYQEVMDGASRPRGHVVDVPAAHPGDIENTIRKTIDYARLFQYPLTAGEVRERLFDVEIDEESFRTVLSSLRYDPEPELLALREEREKISDSAIQEVQPHLVTLASLPFVRMIAFSGSTAHRNMATAEDIDLFIVVEDGKLWATFLTAVLWAKAKGLRKRLCMNYLISDAVLPLFEHDVFTAQQIASLKPIHGKDVYDRFIAANPFVKRCFPNFDERRHRDAYPELQTRGAKRLFETLLRYGPIQIIERFSRFVLGRHLSRKINPASDVQLDPRRLKLHLHSHKRAVLDSSALGSRGI
jgi:glycosyltransferase involved in cell wall biosynthesis